LVSQVVIPIGLCATLQEMGKLEASGVWTAILLGHITRCLLTVARFRQAKWRSIIVE
jgi:Na+-driven multidrug efflux pump